MEGYYVFPSKEERSKVAVAVQESTQFSGPVTSCVLNYVAIGEPRCSVRDFSLTFFAPVTQPDVCALTLADSILALHAGLWTPSSGESRKRRTMM